MATASEACRWAFKSTRHFSMLMDISASNPSRNCDQHCTHGSSVGESAVLQQGRSITTIRREALGYVCRTADPEKLSSLEVCDT